MLGAYSKKAAHAAFFILDYPLTKNSASNQGKI